MASVGGPTDAASIQLQAAYKTFNTALETQESTAQQLIEPVEEASSAESTTTSTSSPEGNIGQNLDVTA